MNTHLTTLTLLLAATISSPVAKAADSPWKFEEMFSAVADDTPLDKLPGWSRHYGEDAAPLVLVAAGHEGGGVRFAGKASFRRAIESRPLSGLPGRDLELRFKIRVMAESDAYTMAQVLLGQSGGVSGLCLRFNGGTRDGWEDNFIQVSAGGANWGRVKLRDLPDSRWRKGAWYEVVVSGIRPDGATNGAPVGGISIVELNGSGDGGKTLVRDETVACVGTDAFYRADVLVIGNAGSSRVFDVDDIVLETSAR